MGALVGLLGVLALVLGLVWLVYAIIKKQPKKKAGLVAILGVVAFGIGMVTTPNVEERPVTTAPPVAEKAPDANVCTIAGIGDKWEYFKGKFPGKETAGMMYAGDFGTAYLADDYVMQVDLQRAESKGKMERIADDIAKDYCPTDAKLVEDKGEASDEKGSRRWWSIYHSDKLEKAVPKSKGNFTIMQRIYDTGTRRVIISIGDSL